jgi:DNA-binding CsgD family transcriptional regulator
LHKKKISQKPDDLLLDEADTQMIRLIADEYTQLEMNEMLRLPTSTIMYLRRRLFAKMKVKNTAGLMRKAINYGLID